MTRRAAELTEAIAGLIVAIDAFHDYRRKMPQDAAGLCRLGLDVEKAAEKVPPRTYRELYAYLADNPDESSTVD